MDLLAQTDWLKIFLCLALGFLTCRGLIPFILQWGASPDGGNRGGDFHHTHDMPAVRLGGVALAAAFVAVALAIYCTGSLDAAHARILGVIVFSALAMFLLGGWDDLRPLGSRFKFAAQIAIAGSAYWGGIKIEFLKDPLTGIDHTLGAFGFLITVLWLVTLTNLINLIDGMDGLAGGICLMLMCLLANLGMGDDSGFSTFLSIGIAGALIGFLRFNYPPAKIYMGDGGAYFLGFLIGTLSIVNSNKGTVVAALIAPAFALALPIADVSLAILRRGLGGLPLFRPDRKHIHHHLIALGFTRERAVLVLHAISLLCLFLAFGVFWWQGRLLPLFSGLLFLVLVTAGHVSGFTRDWPAIKSQLSLRKQTRYALALSRWLEMEAEQHRSMDELWQDYQFVAKKLGFPQVRLLLPNGASIWQAEDFNGNGAGLQQVCHEMRDGSTIEFMADPQVLPAPLLKPIADLAAEMWHKAILRWCALNNTPVPFMTAATLPGFPSPREFIPFPTSAGR